MGSLIAGALDGLGHVVGLAGDATPYVPSAPVQIGTSGPRRGVAEAGSWQGLIVMFGLVLAIGAAVLMYAVRQRTRVLERRRVRRMAATVALMGDADEAIAVTPATSTLAATLAASLSAGIPVRAAASSAGSSGGSSTASSAGSSAATSGTSAPPKPPRTTPATPGRPAPNA